MKNMKMAMVGCGDIARYTALGAKLNRGIEISACMDIDKGRAAKFAKRFRIKSWFNDYEEMLENAEIDAVYIASPHDLHVKMIRSAISKGLDVLCEKPVATNIDDALVICRLSRESGRKVGINYQYRYDNGCYALVTAARGGELGDIYYGRCNVPWWRDQKYFEDSPWHRSLARSGGGTLLTQASHIVDIMLLCVGRPVSVIGVVDRKVFKDTEVEDTALGVIKTAGGGQVSVTSSMVAVPEQKVVAELYGSRGTGIYRGPESPKVDFKGVKVRKAKPPGRGLSNLHALFRSIEGFRRWVIEGERFLTPVEETLPVLSAIAAFYSSSKSGKWEPVDDRYLEFVD
ncbi:MAG: Gfo/Idh/MocA family oxidoreductase [Deltaproteobacteria bacterium]|uniref:Gfo/Idh/MocA family oxidoreductase n=1 Tax=Candidatus Zymogenus saltonus TaxID=2844893 RepID=A0A9D8PPC7_9DELT|nr:Gfo/Idh/MocA family oxidoreductase [Candidatus Zymogenus saltonus]